MIHRMFCIFDAKALAYLPPFVLPEVGMALRTFGDCVNSTDHQFGAHPEDYTLFNIAQYDDKTGLISGLDTRVVVANGVELMRSPDGVARDGNGAEVSDPARADRFLKNISDSIGVDDEAT